MLQPLEPHGEGTRRAKHWDPAHRAAWASAAGVQLFYLSRIMGTSVTQIDQMYGHLVPDSEDYLRGLLNAFDSDMGRRDFGRKAR